MIAPTLLVGLGGIGYDSGETVVLYKSCVSGLAAALSVERCGVKHQTHFVAFGSGTETVETAYYAYDPDFVRQGLVTQELGLIKAVIHG